MSDIILIYPSCETKNARVLKTEDTDKSIENLQITPPLGLAYLASCLEKYNFSTVIIDMIANSLTYKEVVDIIRKEKPPIVGIYTNSFQLTSIKFLIKEIKKKIKTKIIVGGHHITQDPLAIIHLDADYGFKGEAEVSLPLIVDSIKRHKEPKNIPGLVTIKKQKIICNGVAKVENLDSLPFPARHLLPNEKYYTPLSKEKTTTMFTSRGCIFNCVFCSSHKKNILTRSPENVVKEIEHLTHKNFNFISIEDDFFTFDQKRIKKICDRILERNIKIKWWCATRADFISLDLLKLMKKAGCSFIGFGVESGDENLRNKIIGKNITNNQLITTFNNIKKAKIGTVAFCIFGHPGETLKDMEKTLKFILKINPDYVEFFLSRIIPGSRLFNLALKEKKIGKNIWSDIIKYGDPIPIYTPNHLDIEDLKKIQKKSFLMFYFRPKRILQELKCLKDINDFLFKLKFVFKLLTFKN